MPETWALALKGVLYVFAFWFFGWYFVQRKPLPALGWAVLGGLGRWLGGIVLGLLLFVFLGSFGLPFWMGIAFFAFFRLCLWAMLAGFLYDPPRKRLFAFASIMTVANFALDLAIYGPPKASEFLQPVRWTGYH